MTQTLQSSVSMPLFSLLSLSLLSIAFATCGPGNFLSAGVCAECPAGAYQPEINATSCIQCSTGTFSVSPGAQGFDLCQLCPPGTFSNEKGATFCKTCPPGKDSNQASEKCFTCGPGRAISFFSEFCRRCPKSTYSDEPTNRACKGCGFGFVSEKGSTKQSDCQRCPPGTRSSLGKCEPCFFGQFNDGTMRFCKSCPLGFFAGSQGLAKCDQCPPGTFQYRGLTQFCRDCPDGFTTKGSGNVLCRRIGADCPPNTFQAKNGDCLFCGKGLRLDKKQGRCVFCKPGFASQGGLSTSCERCSQLVSEDRSECTCKRGFFLSPDGRCVKCPPGTERIFIDFEVEKCEECIPGHFAPKAGTEQCENCPFGMVSTNRRATSCKRCANGLIPDSRQASCISPKTGCPPGLRRPSNLGEFPRFVTCVPVICPSGTFRGFGDRCIQCEAGSVFMDDSSGKRCVACQRNAVSNGGFDTVCIECPSGLIRSADKTSCVPPCPAGTKTIFEGCEQCPPGTFSALANSSKCRDCPAGTAAEQAGSSKCDVCPDGTFSYGDGFATKCLQIDANVGFCESPCRAGKPLVGCQAEDAACRLTFVRRKCGPMGEFKKCKVVRQRRNKSCSQFACPSSS